MPPLPNHDQRQPDMKQWTIHARQKIWCLKNGLKLGCSKNFACIFGSSGRNHPFPLYVLPKNEYCEIFHFEINPEFNYKFDSGVGL